MDASDLLAKVEHQVQITHLDEVVNIFLRLGFAVILTAASLLVKCVEKTVRAVHEVQEHEVAIAYQRTDSSQTVLAVEQVDLAAVVVKNLQTLVWLEEVFFHEAFFFTFKNADDVKPFEVLVLKEGAVDVLDVEVLAAGKRIRVKTEAALVGDMAQLLVSNHVDLLRLALLDVADAADSAVSCILSLVADVLELVGQTVCRVHVDEMLHIVLADEVFLLQNGRLVLVDHRLVVRKIYEVQCWG